jgi:mono/diheme cytochrome c family protein
MLRGFVLGVIVTLIVLAAIVYAGLTSGAVPADADATPSALEIWAANTSLEATLKRDAPKGPNPVPLTEANLIDGVTLYGRYCAACHGTSAGNAAPTPIARGEYPSPPQLGTDGVEDDPEGVTFWKIDHGIRLTGMPSWRKTLTDQQMWTLALFLKHMDKLPPAADAAWKSLQLGPQPLASPGAAKAPSAARPD